MAGFQGAFEQVVPELVAAAWDFAERSEVVEFLWVYVSFDRGDPFANAFFQVQGEKLYKVELKKYIPGLDVSSEAQGWLNDRLWEAGAQIVRLVGDDAELPRRMILRFEPASGELNADFFYGEFEPDVKWEERVLDVEIADAWWDRLKATGNDSAQP